MCRVIDFRQKITKEIASLSGKINQFEQTGDRLHQRNFQLSPFCHSIIYKKKLCQNYDILVGEFLENTTVK